MHQHRSSGVHSKLATASRADSLQPLSLPMLRSAWASADRPSPTGTDLFAVLNFNGNPFDGQTRVSAESARMWSDNPSAWDAPESPWNRHSRCRSPAACDEFAGVPEELQTVGSLPTRVGVGKMHPDIAQAAAPRIASVIACESTSASECPSSPISRRLERRQDQRPARSDRGDYPNPTRCGYPRQDALRSAISSEWKSRAKLHIASGG